MDAAILVRTKPGINSYQHDFILDQYDLISSKKILFNFSEPYQTTENI